MLGSVGLRRHAPSPPQSFRAVSATLFNESRAILGGVCGVRGGEVAIIPTSIS